MRKLVVFILIALPLLGFSQKEINIRFVPMVNGEKLALDSGVFLWNKKETTVSAFRWYLSNFKLNHKGETVWEAPKKHVLLDASKPQTLQLNFQPPNDLVYDELECLLGIDSITQVSGVFGADLDPTNGMYWTWQSGYIHVKVEGVSAGCSTRKNQFQYHLGGYAGEQNTLQTLRWTLDSAGEKVVAIDIGDFLSNYSCESKHHVMSPGLEAVKMAKQFANLFLD